VTKGRHPYKRRTSFLLPPEPFTRANRELKLLPSVATQAYGGAAIFFFITLLQSVVKVGIFILPSFVVIKFCFMV
jgi:hypothetical protein